MEIVGPSHVTFSIPTFLLFESKGEVKVNYYIYINFTRIQVEDMYTYIYLIDYVNLWNLSNQLNNLDHLMVNRMGKIRIA